MVRINGKCYIIWSSLLRCFHIVIPRAVPVPVLNCTVKLEIHTV